MAGPRVGALGVSVADAAAAAGMSLSAGTSEATAGGVEATEPVAGDAASALVGAVACELVLLATAVGDSAGAAVGAADWAVCGRLGTKLVRDSRAITIQGHNYIGP